MHYPLVYEINTRCWLRELSERSGRPLTLATVPESECGYWQRLGFTHIWLMGVWSLGPRSREIAWAGDAGGQAGQGGSGGEAVVTSSPYAVAGYHVCSSLGGESGLQVFRRQLRKNGIKLILDFIPNHVGLDHPWARERPDLFVQARVQAPGTFPQQSRVGNRWLAHGKDPYFPPWTDTVQLDYRNPDTRLAMKQVLFDIADRCDGVRCDMAMLLLSDIFLKNWARFSVSPAIDPIAGEFWADAIQSVRRAHADFLFLRRCAEDWKRGCNRLDLITRTTRNFTMI